MSEFLAEARVVVTPDTTRFRADLVRQLTAATRTPIPIRVTPVVTGVGGQQAAATAAKQTAAAQTAGAVSAQKATASSKAYAQALQAQAAVSVRLAGIEEAMSVTTTKLAASRARLREVSAAAALSQTALQRAIATGNVALVQAQANVTRLVLATRELAVADIQATIAENELAAASARRAQSSRAATQGAIAQSAALAGLRGSVVGANAAFIAGVGSVLAFGRAVQSAAQLETELNVFRVTASATADEMERVSEQAKALGRDLTLPGVTATDAAQTFLALSRAGLSVENSLEGARGVLQLAVAAQISFADAAQITASALNAFALQGEEAVSVADLLTNAANASQASIGDMGIALRQSAAIADLAGFSLSETVTFLTQLARAGLAGSDAGTSFRVSIQRLIAPVGAARKEIERLKINLRDAQGDLRPEAFFELGEALERMGRAQGDATRQIIFGNDASRAAAFFARVNAQAFREQETALKKQGSAAEVAGARNEGFAGSVENLKNQVSALGIEIGELALPVLGTTADVAATFFGLLATQIGDTKEALAGLGEDASKLGEGLRQISDDSGFTDFLEDVADGAGVVARELGRTSNDVDRAAADLLGLGGAAEDAVPGFREITAEERKFMQSVIDALGPAKEQTTGFDELAAAAERAAASVARLQGQERGLEEQVTRARIAGDEEAEIAGLREQRAKLEEELRQQEEIIRRPGTAGEATAREAIRNRILPQLEAVNNEINNIIEGQRIENERLAQDAARAASERDRALLEALSGRRGGAERAVAIAGDTEGVRDDIRAQNSLQALIKQQIQKVRERVKDEKLRRDVIRELRLALQDSRREEELLREEQKRTAAAERASAIEQRAQGLELDIELADINENDARRVKLRRQRIAQLKREARLLKLEGNALKENRNERARIRKEIAEILREDKEGQGEGNGFPESAFEFLQQQQGFAANLFGNLIPSSATAGLVGGSQADPLQTSTAAVQAQTAAGVVAGPTRGQVATEVDVLKEMLQVLRAIQRGNAHPEATRQRKSQGGSMDTLVL